MVQVPVKSADVTKSPKGYYVLSTGDSTIYPLNEKALVHHLKKMKLPDDLISLILESVSELGCASFSA